MPTSLGTMHIFFGPPPPPPSPWDGCWPTPHDAATRTKANSRATRPILKSHVGLDTYSLLLFGTLCTSSRTVCFPGCGSLLPSPEKLVKEHSYEQQDA